MFVATTRNFSSCKFICLCFWPQLMSRLCSLTLPKQLASLASFISERRWPEFDNETESYRYPYIATEIMCCSNPELTAELLGGSGSCLPSPDAGFATHRAAQHALTAGTVRETRHIHRLLGVLDVGAPIQEYRVSYVTRVLSSLAASAPLRLMAAVATCPFPLAKRALQNAHIQATGELLRLLLSLPWPEGSAPCAALALSEADVQGGSSTPAGGSAPECAPLVQGLLHALGCDVGGAWIALSQHEASAAAETAHGVVAACTQRMLVAPTDDFKQAHSFSRQPIRGAGGEQLADSAPSPFCAQVTPLTRAHAASRLDPSLYSSQPSTTLHCTPAAQLVKALLYGEHEAAWLAQAAVHSICQPASTPPSPPAGRHLAPALKPAAVPADERILVAKRLGASVSCFDTLWGHGDFALLSLASVLQLAARVSGGGLAQVDGRSAQAQSTVPALVKHTGSAVPLMCSYLHALCDAAEEYASQLPPSSAGSSARCTRVGKALVSKEAHHLPRLGSIPMAVVHVLVAWLRCRWQGAPPDAASGAWIALLRTVRFFPWASLLHQEVCKAAEAVLVQSDTRSVHSLVVRAQLPQWILKRSNEQRLLTDCSQPFAAAPSVSVGFIPQLMNMAQALEAARLGDLLPAAASAAVGTDAWAVFVNGALTTHILRQSVTLGGPVPSGKNLSGDTGDLRVDEVPAAAGV